MRTLSPVSIPVLVLFALLSSATASAVDLTVPDSITHFEIVGDLVVVATEFGLEVVGLPVRKVP